MLTETEGTRGGLAAGVGNRSGHEGITENEGQVLFSLPGRKEMSGKGESSNKRRVNAVTCRKGHLQKNRGERWEEIREEREKLPGCEEETGKGPPQGGRTTKISELETHGEGRRFGEKESKEGRNARAGVTRFGWGGRMHENSEENQSDRNERKEKAENRRASPGIRSKRSICDLGKGKRQSRGQTSEKQGIWWEEEKEQNGLPPDSQSERNRNANGAVSKGARAKQTRKQKY